MAGSTCYSTTPPFRACQSLYALTPQLLATRTTHGYLPGGETLQQEPGDRSAFHVNEADQGTEAADEELDDLNAARETAELSERNPF